MAAVRVQESASWRLDEIYRYTQSRWGDAQADRYITGLFEAFDRIESHGVMSRPIPASLGVSGFFFRYRSHFVYWKRLSNGDIGIVTVLNERMHRTARLQQEFAGLHAGPASDLG